MNTDSDFCLAGLRRGAAECRIHIYIYKLKKRDEPGLCQIALLITSTRDPIEGGVASRCPLLAGRTALSESDTRRGGPAHNTARRPPPARAALIQVNFQVSISSVARRWPSGPRSGPGRAADSEQKPAPTREDLTSRWPSQAQRDPGRRAAKARARPAGRRGRRRTAGGGRRRAGGRGWRWGGGPGSLSRGGGRPRRP